MSDAAPHADLKTRAAGPSEGPPDELVLVVITGKARGQRLAVRNDRVRIGKATTNRAANVREEPLANATVVRQLGNGMELQILAKYAGVKEETWYEVVTASGKTHGFVRDYVVYVTKLDKNAPTLTYEK